MNEFDIVIGLEVHVHLKTDSKIFCSCSTYFESPPNTNICPVCCGHPGVLPVFNQKALKLATRVSLALNCRVNRRIYFERKNYFYPDLPKNFQISQYKMPLGEDGFLQLPQGKKTRIARVHLEEDAGKLIHKDAYSLVDFNRSGIPLLEIVSYPDIASPQEAFQYLSYLKLTLEYIKASDCNMEKGSLRADANISLKKKGETALGTKVELKNMNTFTGVRDALEFEAHRQERVLKKGERVLQETRLWDAARLASVLMRSKEEAHDYRYFPEPDLLDFFVSDEFIAEEHALLREPPTEKKKRFLEKYMLSEKEVDIFVADIWLADFFEKCLHFFPKPKETANWLLGPFLEQVKNFGAKYDAVKISAQNFSKIVKYFSEGNLNNITAKKALALSIATDKDIDTIIAEEALTQVSDQDELLGYANDAINSNPKAANEYLSGKQEALEFLVGNIMKKTKGKANPKVARELLEKALNERKLK